MSGFQIIGPPPAFGVYNNGVPVSGAQVAFYVATTSDGTATVYPTSDGTATGTPLFSSIFHASATLWYNSSSMTGVPAVTGKTISGSNAVTFNITNGSSVNTNSVTLTASVWGVLA